MGEAEKKARGKVTGDPAANLLDAVFALDRALKKIGVVHMLIGGLAVIMRGAPRHTDDVDATLWAKDSDIKTLLAALDQEGIVGRIPDVEQFARENAVLLLLHSETGTPIEISLAWLPFEREALDRAEELVIRDRKLSVALPEDLVIYKAAAWRDKDKLDIQQLLRLYHKNIDLERVRRLIREFAEALEEPERPDEFERLLKKTFP